MIADDSAMSILVMHICVWILQRPISITTPWPSKPSGAFPRHLAACNDEAGMVITHRQVQALQPCENDTVRF
jgi:hypothetical protein